MMSRSKRYASCTLAVLLSLLFAFPFPTPADGQVAAGSDAALPLWEVSRGEDRIYLLGSVHMLRPESYPLDPALYEAFDAAEVVAFEIDLGAAAAAAPLMMARGLYTDGRTLRSELPAAVYQDVGSRAAAYGIPLQALEPMKPWLVSITLNGLALQRLGYAPNLGVDMHFFERARSSGKRIQALETIEDQVQVFDGLSADQQASLLESTLDEIESAADTMDEIASIWARGDVQRLADMMNESLEEHPVLLERILYQRNRNWVPQIEALLAADQPAIVIVGMGHMVGSGSVTDLLREKGYRVEPVVAAGAR
jgi:uncharacterized protein YbaP (TraB family)